MPRHRPAADAACVALARAAGAIVLGKTVTTEFACFTPGKTANPRNPAHTPGGSSSGSAAAVADRMVPLAFGTQTAGSVIRPAAFCGVVGYKPSFGTIPRAGVKMLCDSLDTVGTMARNVADAAFFAGVVAGRPALRDIAPSRQRRRVSASTARRCGTRPSPRRWRRSTVPRAALERAGATVDGDRRTARARAPDRGAADRSWGSSWCAASRMNGSSTAPSCRRRWRSFSMPG